MKRPLARVLLTCGVAVALPVTPVLAAGFGPPGWRLQATISVPGRNVVLYSVAADGPGDAWVIGDATLGNLATPAVFHWNGRRWQRVRLPASVTRVFGPSQELKVIGASSAADVWAFDSFGHWMRLSGGRWTAGQLPPARGGQAPAIQATLVLGRADVWAFGSGAVAYAAHFDGRRWRATPVPGGTGITDASAISPRNIWAVQGQDVLRWDGHRWHVVIGSTRLAPGFVLLASVLARSARSVWVGGGAENSAGGETEAVAHWNGRSWRVANLPAGPMAAPYELTSLVPDGSGGLWGMGTSNNLGGWRLWHFTGTTWRAVPRPVPGTADFSTLSSELAWPPGSASAWAAGWFGASPNQKGMILLTGRIP